jgi:UDP-N-acetylglucosamine 2-epimerase
MIRPRIASLDKCWIETLKHEIIRIPLQPSKNARHSESAKLCEKLKPIIARKNTIPVIVSTTPRCRITPSTATVIAPNTAPEPDAASSHPRPLSPACNWIFAK